MNGEDILYVRWVPLFLLILPLAWGMVPQSVQIEVFLTGGSPVKGSEVYVFPKHVEDNLSQIASAIGFRYSLWKGKVEGFMIHGCDEKDARDISIVLKDVNGFPSVLLSYTCPSPELLSEGFLERTLRYKEFVFPIVGGFMVIPENYTLRVSLPHNARVVKTNPPAEREGDSVVWNGPLNTPTRFSVTYTIPKVYTVPSISMALYNLLTDPYVFFPLVAVVILLISTRDKIKEKIVQWVSSLSEIEKE